MSKLVERISRHYLLILVLLIAFWFRVQGFLYSTFAFTYDVGRDMLAVSNMLQTHKPLLIGATTGMHGIFYGPTWYYLLSPFFIIFQGDPRGIALVMALSGVLTVFFGYFAGRNIGGKLLGLIAAFLLGVSQVLTEISAQIWNPNFIPLFIVVVIFLLSWESIHKKKYFPVLLGIILGVIFDLEIVFGVLFFVSTITYLILKEKFRKKFVFFPILLTGLVAVQLPRIFFELRHDFLMTRTLLNSFVETSTEKLLTPIPNLLKIFEVLFKVWTDTVAWQNPIFAAFSLLVCIFVIVLTFKKLNNIQKKMLIFFSVITVVYFVGLSFFNHDIESHYYIGIPLVFIFILSLTIYLYSKYINSKPILLIFILVLFGVSINQLKLVGTLTPNSWIGDASVYRNQVEVIDYIYKDANGQKFNYATYTPPIFDYPYQYLFKWYGQRVYGYVPETKTQELFYLILEPDLQIPERQKMWLEIRKDDGVFISDKNFKSGIVVQKRLH